MNMGGEEKWLNGDHIAKGYPSLSDSSQIWKPTSSALHNLQALSRGKVFFRGSVVSLSLCWEVQQIFAFSRQDNFLRVSLI